MLLRVANSQARRNSSTACYRKSAFKTVPRKNKESTKKFTGRPKRLAEDCERKRERCCSERIWAPVTPTCGCWVVMLVRPTIIGRRAVVLGGRSRSGIRSLEALKKP